MNHPVKDTHAFQHEWTLLHHNIENYEKFALVIKLVAILLCCWLFISKSPIILTTLLILILWVLEGVWKTFQSRLIDRILLIEKSINTSMDDTSQAFQLYSTWESSRRSQLGLIKEYVLNSLKPTVMYPYLILVLISCSVILL